MLHLAQDNHLQLDNVARLPLFIVFLCESGNSNNQVINIH